MKMTPDIFIRYACGPAGIMWFFLPFLEHTHVMERRFDAYLIRIGNAAVARVSRLGKRLPVR